MTPGVHAQYAQVCKTLLSAQKTIIFKICMLKKVELCRSQFSVLIQKGNQEKVGENERRDANDNDN